MLIDLPETNTGLFWLSNYLKINLKRVNILIEVPTQVERLSFTNIQLTVSNVLAYFYQGIIGVCFIRAGYTN
jgi:hypothetical protein